MDTKSDDSLDKSLQQKCVVDDSKPVESSVRNELLTTTAVGAVASTAAVSTQQRKTDPSGSINSKVAAAINTTANSSSDIRLVDSPDSSPPSGTNFDKKVKQISKDLKETTLAEPGDEESNSSSITHNAGDTRSTTTASSSSSSTTSSTSSSSSSSSTVSTTPEDEQTSLVQRDDDDDALLQDESPEDGASALIVSASDSFDERSKKVRFHPDAKENDGGNRVKKKKLKTSPSELEGAVGGVPASEVCGMDLDDDEDEDDDAADEDIPIDENQDYEEEEEFDLAKTIAEAEDYLKQHPLTFVSPNEQTGERLKDGLLDIEDMPQLAESSEDEDFYANVLPENNVQRVLGRQVKGGQVEFLLRYADRPGLFWETENFIQKQCPTMLTLYEKHRERRQERLMRHVAKRQNLRQRYTDF